MRLGPDGNLVVAVPVQHAFVGNVRGVLKGCQIVGRGDIVIAGEFIEGGASPGIVGPRRLHVGQTGTIVAAVQQASTLAEFGFEHGCSLSLRIRKE